MSLPARADDGQASIEWVAVVAVVAGVLALAVAFGHGQDHYVGRTITRQWARALCIVRAGDCWRDKEPCVVRSEDEEHGLTVQLLVVKLGGNRRALLEQRSDGSFALTDVHEGAGGIDVDGGQGFTFKVAGMDVEAGSQLEASIAARMGRAKTWFVDSLADAEQLVDDLRENRSVRDPDVSTSDNHIDSALRASASADAGGETVDVSSAGFSGDRIAGSRVDHRTGHRTLYAQWSWNASLSAAGGVLGASHSAVGEVYGVELDERGRPIDLQILDAGSVADGLPDVALGAGALLRAGPGAVYEVTSHLDLTDRDNLALAKAVIGDVTAHKTPNEAEVQALRRRIDEQGTVEARVLGTRSSTDGTAISGTFKGGRVGFNSTSETTSTQLEAAASRGLDGQWLPREDCVPAAA